jgi:hypothetical protein
VVPLCDFYRRELFKCKVVPLRKQAARHED